MEHKKQKALCFYPHPSSNNHGCEAIAISTAELISPDPDLYKLILLTKFHINDDRFGNRDVEQYYTECVHCPLPLIKRYSFDWIKHIIVRIIKRADESVAVLAGQFSRRNRKLIESADGFISIGGDNYCYGRPAAFYAVNRAVNNFGKKTVLWACSIEPESIDTEMIDDLRKYSAIFARESITYKALSDKGLENIHLYPDPAFTLKKMDPRDNSPDLVKGTVGINVSPLIMNYESKSQIVFDAYKKLMEYILDNTSLNISLIPHVVSKTTDDRIVLQRLYSIFEDTGRVEQIENHNCMELKTIIGNCRFFIGARTHATIAAYSSCVPTLVCGYSVKARGIACDIFGDAEHYVLPVQSLTNGNELVQAFIWLLHNELKIREKLNRVMPEYIERARQAGKVLGDAIRA